ncbi:hypothetical protein FVE67_07545 [Thermosulfurimonas marina]|uniref:Uncharacterized protein n=1 Tax=Thermosulfurimonas marina TaxID=2047767 RepID=A0A6H1WTV5_9BACT|nr:hypothetical protein [Thermosulfurimonas marina]QJA06655.1 hypothetical protein FVE67_07545 [Thermosulfurimonas marina]
MRGFSLFLLLGFLWGVAPALKAEEVRYNWWPLFFYAQSPEAQRLELFGPLVGLYRNNHERSLSVRPLFSRVFRNGEEDIYFLSPLGYYHREEGYRRFRLVPLFSYDSFEEDKAGPAEHHTYFPIFWGKDSRGEGYWGIFPLYGVMRERLGYDEIRFFLWPLYSSARQDGNLSTNILWPFFNYSRGPELSGFKFWPLFGWRERKGEYRRRFFLWPVFIREDRYGAEGELRYRKRYYWPLYGQEGGEGKQRRFWLWPFFQKVDSPAYRKWDFPWPFFQVIRGKERGLRLWPLFGWRKSADWERNFVLWPLFFGEHLSRGPEEEVSGRFLLLSHYRRVDYQGKPQEKFLRLWPFFLHYEHLSEDRSLFYFPALLPFYDEGLERNIGSFLRLFEYYRFGPERSYIKVLWGLYRYEREKESRLHELAFLLGVRMGKETLYLRLLNGLLGLGRCEGHWHFEIFWKDL